MDSPTCAPCSVGASASSMSFAIAFPEHRRLAVTSGVLALVFAAADLTERVR